MSGRGKPRSQLTFNAELLGVGRGSLEPPPTSVLDPPPIYPPLRVQPKLPPSRHENLYLASRGKDFLNRMKDSPFYLTEQSNVRDLFEEIGLDPNRFPSELIKMCKKVPKLRGEKRKCASVPNLTAKRARTDSSGDINVHLDKLEAKEQESEKEETDEKEGAETKDSDDKETDGADDDLEEVDEEMDDETDYAKDYFDNGEGYLDEEDDNLDEGGIY